MRPFLGLTAALVTLLASASLALPAGAAAPNAPVAPAAVQHRPVCGPPAAGSARCHALVRTRADGVTPLASTSLPSSAYGPADLHGAYQLPGLVTGTFTWNGQTIAIVDAYDNPNVAADLLAYRRQFGLPLCSDGGVGCILTKLNQSGAASPLPRGDVGWGQEIDLDVEMAAAICPSCRILLVEGNSASFTDLGAAVDSAARMGANAISNSYGGNEFQGEASNTYNGHFNHPGIAITVSSGDSGYGAEFPAASQYVTAVGGTTLTYDRATGNRSEKAWSGAGSGCSAYIQQPTWQAGLGSCTRRSVADVSAVADPGTGVAVYDSYGSTGGANWFVFGGTSVAAPIVAGVYALAGNAGGSSPAITYGEYPYRTFDSGTQTSPSLFDVTAGTNGRCTTRKSTAGLYLCSAVTGYDGPTGLGTPKGAGAF